MGGGAESALRVNLPANYVERQLGGYSAYRSLSRASGRTFWANGEKRPLASQAVNPSSESKGDPPDSTRRCVRADS
jgi:hypothetical protein